MHTSTIILTQSFVFIYVLGFQFLKEKNDVNCSAHTGLAEIKITKDTTVKSDS